MADNTSSIGKSRAAAPALPRLPLVARLAGRIGAVSLEDIAERERDRLFLWAPVAFGVGIVIYFALPREPALAAIAALCVVTGIVAVRSEPGRLSGTLFMGLFLASLGLADASLRSRYVAAPVVAESKWPLAVTGRVTAVERREDGAVRLFVRPAGIETVAEGDLPHTLSLWMRGKWPVPEPGDAVRFKAMLRPPPDAALPGGFDYARQAWFQRIGGVGFITGPPTPATDVAEADPGARLAAAIERLRLSITARITDAVPGPTGAIAAALVAGLRGAIPEEDDEALRASGLAHVLSISGLHMVLVVGTLFWVVRATFALSPRLALTRPIKKWAAAVALVGGTGYLLLSGAEVATQRAYIMTAIMLIAVLVDRPAITLRNVAIATLVVLVMTPESLMSASFQMSFAATVALVAAYEAMRSALSGAARSPAASPVLRHVRGAVVGLIVTSLVAGLATAPYGAYHFNRVAMYGLVANAAAMPLVSLLVMPAGLASVCLMPFGLEGPALAVMAFGIEGMMRIAEVVASWDGAVRTSARMPVAALLAMTAGGLWLSLWHSRLRLLGVPVIVAGLVMTGFEPTPDLFVSRDARTAALVTGDGGLVFLPRASSSYEAELWERSVGILLETAAARRRPACDARACVADNGRLRVSYVTDPMAFEEDCAWADVVVSRLDPPGWCGATAIAIGPAEAERSGATTVRRIDDGLAIETAARRAGDRPWAQRSR